MNKIKKNNKTYGYKVRFTVSYCTGYNKRAQKVDYLVHLSRHSHPVLATASLVLIPPISL